MTALEAENELAWAIETVGRRCTNKLAPPGCMILDQPTAMLIVELLRLRWPNPERKETA